MGGSASIISTVLGSVTSLAGAVTGLTQSKRDSSSSDMERERQAREESQRKKEADARRRDRDKVMEARTLEKKRNSSTLSSGAASLNDETETNPAGLKKKLGE